MSAVQPALKVIKGCLGQMVLRVWLANGGQRETREMLDHEGLRGIKGRLVLKGTRD